MESSIVEGVLDHFLAIAQRERFAILAYCFMPDHVHLLATGTSIDANFVRFMNAAKQQAGYWYLRRSGCRLWQKGYYDHILQDGESTSAVIRYIVENPVRAGLVRSPHDYPFLGSAVVDVAALCEEAGEVRSPDEPHR